MDKKPVRIVVANAVLGIIVKGNVSKVSGVMCIFQHDWSGGFHDVTCISTSTEFGT